MIGYQGDKNLGRQVYENLFKDGEGRVGLDQVFLLVNGRQCNLRRLRGRVSELAIDPTQPDALLDETSEWNAEQLRRQLQFMLLRAHVSPVELLAEWDSDESGELSKREFLVHMRKHFHFGDGAGQRIWDTKARFTAGEIFDLVAEGDRSISCLEMERWLDKNWPDYSGDARPAPRPDDQRGRCIEHRIVRDDGKSAKNARGGRVHRLAHQAALWPKGEEEQMAAAAVEERAVLWGPRLVQLVAPQAQVEGRGLRPDRHGLRHVELAEPRVHPYSVRPTRLSRELRGELCEPAPRTATPP